MVTIFFSVGFWPIYSAETPEYYSVVLRVSIHTVWVTFSYSVYMSVFWNASANMSCYTLTAINEEYANVCFNHNGFCNTIFYFEKIYFPLGDNTGCEHYDACYTE